MTTKYDEMNERMKSRRRDRRHWFLIGLGIIFVSTASGLSFSEFSWSGGIEWRWWAGDMEHRQFYALLGVIVSVPFFMKAAFLLTNWSRASHPHRAGLYAAIIAWLLASSHFLGRLYLSPERAFDLFVFAACASVIYAVAHFGSHMRAYLRELIAKARRAKTA